MPAEKGRACTPHAEQGGNRQRRGRGGGTYTDYTAPMASQMPTRIRPRNISLPQTTFPLLSASPASFSEGGHLSTESSFFFPFTMLKHLALLIFCASARALLSPALWSYSTQRSRAVKLVHHASLHRSRRLRQSLATGKVTANLAVPSLAQESAPEILTVDISAFFRNDPAGAF